MYRQNVIDFLRLIKKSPAHMTIAVSIFETCDVAVCNTCDNKPRDLGNRDFCDQISDLIHIVKIFKIPKDSLYIDKDGDCNKWRLDIIVA